MIRQALRRSLAATLLVISGLTVAAAPDPYDGAVEHARLTRTMTLDGEIFHVQGLALDATHIWVTSVDTANHRGYIHEFDRATGAFRRRLELTDGVRYHPGGMSLTGRSIWVPVAEPRPDSSAILVEIDADSLRVRHTIPVADHLGCVAASGTLLVAGNWDSRLLYVFDTAGHAPPRIVPNPTQTPYQDMKFVGRRLVASGPTSLWGGAIDWIDWPSMTVRHTLRAGSVASLRPFAIGRSFTGEGMAIEGRNLYLLPEDGPSRLFHFTLDA